MDSEVKALYIIVTLFVGLGILLPYIQAEFGEDQTNNDVSGLTSIDSDDATSSVGLFTVLGSVFTMFFWTFGNLPVWLDAFLFIPLRVILAYVIIRVARGGG